jgi:proteasome assembly chaperone (PAC2) family protein
MNFLRRETRGVENPLKSSGQPELQHASLVVGWSPDAGRLGPKITDYLIRKLEGRSFCEIEPQEFFPLDGAAVDEDLIQFPESGFYACTKNNLVIFKSTPPSHEWYRFLNLILDVAGHHHMRELYTIGAMISLSAHTTPRELLGAFSSPELKDVFSPYNIGGDVDYETPPGQRPTLNSFLLWAAKRRNIPGIGLWVPIPFYLITVDDLKAQRRVLEFFNQRFNLGMNFSDLDEEIREQSKRLAQARDIFPNIDESIKRLESNLRLSEEENQELVRGIEKFLREKGD